MRFSNSYAINIIISFGTILLPFVNIFIFIVIESASCVIIFIYCG